MALEDELRKQAEEDPRVLESIFKSIHARGLPIDADFIDGLLGLPKFKLGIEPDPNDELNHYQGEQGVYVETPYYFIRRVLLELNPQSFDLVYDLGAGYGKLPFYGALTTQAYYRGVEFVPHRAAVAREVKGRMKIKRVDFLEGNVLDHDFSDGTMFYMCQPFTPKTLSVVADKLGRIAQHHPVKVATAFLDEFEPLAASWARGGQALGGAYSPLRVYHN